MQLKQYEMRRKALMERMDGGAVIISSTPLVARCRDVNYEFRQDSDFYYLTGFEEPESFCLLAPEHAEHKFVMFVRSPDELKDRWEGKTVGVEGAIGTYGADMAYSVNQLDEILPKYLNDVSTLYYRIGQYESLDQKILQHMKRYRATVRTGVNGPTTLVDLGEILDPMRMIKQKADLDSLRKAASITGEAHIEAMKTVQPGLHEYEIQALVEYVFRKHGAPRNGFETIVGSGPNSTVLHYVANNRCMEAGDLVVIDAGAEYEYYTADITRTIPVNGHFSAEQKAIYNLALKAQTAAIDEIQPGVSFVHLYQTSVQVITQGLVELGLLNGNVEELIDNETYKKFYMHPIGHWIGLDIRDPGKYKVNGQWRILESGMVFTVEPGIYISEGIEGVDPIYWNIGVRIEDNLLVTDDGYEVLTAKVPKTVEEIEALMSKE